MNIRAIIKNRKIIARSAEKYILNHISRVINDETYLKLLFKIECGKTLNLKEPITFNEKLQWLKLHDRKEIYTKLVDKAEVKYYIADLMGEQYIIPTIGIWDEFDDINFDKLPNQFVLKCTHDSGGLIVCTDKSKLNIDNARLKINKCLKRNYFYFGREWPYKNVKPRIIAEKYMYDREQIDGINDYKLFLFSGKVFCVQVDYDRFFDHHRNFYDTEWNYLPFTTCYPTDPQREIKKPECLEEMISFAEKLSDSIGNPAHVRIDMYIIEGKLFFGEVTFYHGSGCEKFMPEEWDKILGDQIVIEMENE